MFSQKLIINSGLVKQTAHAFQCALNHLSPTSDYFDINNLNKTIQMKSYTIVKWPECQLFMNERNHLFLAIENAYDDFGDTSYFVDSK